MGYYEDMLKEVDALETSVTDNTAPVPLENPIPEPVEIYFSDLPIEKQDAIIDGLESILNTTAEDSITGDKITKYLGEKPIVVLDLEEFRRSMGRI